MAGDKFLSVGTLRGGELPGKGLPMAPDPVSSQALRWNNGVVSPQGPSWRAVGRFPSCFAEHQSPSEPAPAVLARRALR